MYHLLPEVEMNTKSTTQLYLLDKCPPIFNESRNYGFTGPFPPTREQILLQYYGYHRYLQESTKLQSKKLDAISLVVHDTEDWWEKPGIALKSRSVIKKQVVNIINEYKALIKNKSRKSETEERKRKEFLENLKNTFWIVQPVHENKLKIQYEKGRSTQRDTNDWLYLQGVRGKNRTATLGSFDEKLAKRKKRTLDDQEAYEARKSKSSKIATVHKKSDNYDDTDIEEAESSNYAPPVVKPSQKIRRKIKKTVFTRSCIIDSRQGRNLQQNTYRVGNCFSSI